MKITTGLRRSLLLSLAALTSTGAHIMEEINQKVAHAPFGCDVWELCCSPNSGLTQACLDVGLRAERYTIEKGFDLRKRTVGMARATKAKEVKVRKAWGSPPCTDFSAMLNLTQNENFRKNLPRRRSETRAIVRNFVLTFKQVILGGGDIYYEWPTGCHGWNIAELVELYRFLSEPGY